MRVREGQYECALCSARLDLPFNARPKVMIKAATGQPTWRVLSIAGQEIHRCERRRADTAWRDTPDEAVVFTAAGIAAEQARCSVEDAITKLSERAEATGRTVPDVARLVIAGAVRFDP